MHKVDFKFLNQTIQELSPVVYDGRFTPFCIHGLYHPEVSGLFRRMPQEIAEATSKKVSLLHTNTSGARLRFQTDSEFIAIAAQYPPMEFSSPRSAATSCANSFCFDLYVDGEYCCLMMPQNLHQTGSVVHFEIPNGQYEAMHHFESRKLREITLNFPSFVNISEIFIGLQNDCVLKEATPYRNSKPVVFYGSSITQGACASRPGNIYQNILSRRLHFDYLNLGFSGAAKAEPAIIDYLCSLDPCMVVFDFDHNTKNPEMLKQTHYPAMEKLWKAFPEVPIIMLSRPNQCGGEAQTLQRVEVILETYERLKSKGAHNIYFINGQDIFHRYDKDLMTVDGTHPNDFGFFCMAEALEKVMTPLL